VPEVIWFLRTTLSVALQVDIMAVSSGFVGITEHRKLSLLGETRMGSTPPCVSSGSQPKNAVPNSKNSFFRVSMQYVPPWT
jgi:hypothetical protein